MAKKRVGVIFPVSTPAGNGYAVIDERDSHRLLEEHNPDYGRKLGASHSRPRSLPIPWEDAKRYVGGVYRTQDEVKQHAGDKYAEYRSVG